MKKNLKNLLKTLFLKKYIKERISKIKTHAKRNEKK